MQSERSFEMSPRRDILKTFTMKELTVPTLLSRKVYQRPILSCPRDVIQDKEPHKKLM